MGFLFVGGNIFGFSCFFWVAQRLFCSNIMEMQACRVAQIQLLRVIEIQI